MLFIPIPPLFHSAYSGAAFEFCIDCESPLAPSGIVYSVQKFVVANETVFELAICNQCRTALYLQFSEESRAAIQGYIDQHSRPQPLVIVLPHDTEANAETQQVDVESLDSLQACVLCQTHKSQLHRYAMVGLFIGDELMVMNRNESHIPIPCLICDRCNRGMEKLLSKATRDEWNRFIEDHFSGPPGIELDPTHELPLLV
ncbi:MAG: hypothetical protein DWH91_19905 [Planctomycetota bacterium]|nr:MAG: hypothetical protein DWH91_19905 [Planctomycetota bacterium]